MMKELDRAEVITGLVEFIRTSAFEMTVLEIATEIVTLSSYGASWPRASLTQWQRMIREALRGGLLVMNESGRIGPRIETAAPTQLELF